MKVQEAINKAKHVLSTLNTSSLDARLLMQFVLKCSLEELIQKFNEILTPYQIKRYFQLIEKRKKGFPVAYITKNKEFYGRPFRVTTSCLIPRPETEILIDAVLLYNKDLVFNNILELGCGSGCIITTLLLEIENSKAVAVDINLESLKVTKHNARKHKVLKRLNLKISNWLKDLKEHSKYDIIISNPPYVASRLELNMEALYEPEIALICGNEGFESYQIIAKDAHKYLKDKGLIFLEIGQGMEAKVIKIFQSFGFNFKNAFKDLNNITRCLVFGVD